MGQKEAPRIGLLKAMVARRVTGREVAANRSKASRPSAFVRSRQRPSYCGGR